MKKILVAVFASALSLALAAPIASACPGHDSSVAKEKKQETKDSEVANKKSDTKQDSAKKAEQKKPVKVSQK